MSVDELCALLSADTFRDVGIYPKAMRGFGDKDYEERTQYQEGWNAACLEIARSDESVIGLVKANFMALRAENAELLVDAERYRYIRQHAICGPGTTGYDPTKWSVGDPRPETLDAHIDALAALDTKSAVE